MVRQLAKLFKTNQCGYDMARKIYLATLYPLAVGPYRKWQQSERKVSWGNENADKTFYVIRRCDEKCGLFSWVEVIMGHLAKAEQNGWIPVIDMQSYPNPFLEEYEIKKKNAWEFFFKQPSGYSLSDIKKSKNIILSYMFPVKGFLEGDIFLDDKKKNEVLLLRRKYISFQTDIEQNIEQRYSEIIGQEKTLGVICRGTDYWALKPKKHYIQPSIEEIKTQIRKSLAETGCTQIYLCTEDKMIFSALKSTFGDILKVYDRELIEYSGGFLIDSNTKQQETKRNLAYHYLMQIAILAKLKFILAGKNGGAIGAITLSDGFEYEYYWDLGKYS